MATRQRRPRHSGTFFVKRSAVIAQLSRRRFKTLLKHGSLLVATAAPPLQFVLPSRRRGGICMSCLLGQCVRLFQVFRFSPVASSTHQTSLRLYPVSIVLVCRRSFLLSSCSSRHRRRYSTRTLLQQRQKVQARAFACCYRVK